MKSGSRSADTTISGVSGAAEAPHSLISIHLQERQRMFAQAVAAALERTYATRVALGDAARIEEDDASAVIMLGESVEISRPDEATSRPPILVMGERLTDQLVLQCAKVRADGCILMDGDGLDELITAIHGVQKGEWVYPHSMRLRMMEIITTHGIERPNEACPLTPQEQRVLEFLVQDLSMANKQIARRLDISIYTVKNHMHSILEKLGVKSRQHARELALQHRWFSHSKT